MNASRGLTGLLSSWLLLAVACFGAENDTARLARDLRPLLECLSGQRDAFTLSGQFTVPVDGRPEDITLRLVRYDDAAFDLEITHAEYAVQLRRRADTTALALPLHQLVYVGRGASDATDHLQPRGMVSRLISPASAASVYVVLAQQADPQLLALALASLAKLQFHSERQTWQAGDALEFDFGDQGRTVQLTARETRIRLHVSDVDGAPPAAGDWPGMKLAELPRGELERQLARGVRRALEILAPGTSLTAPPQVEKRVAHGQLRWIDGQRVVLLRGTPEQVGQAHAALLQEEAHRCVDSVLYTFGTAQTIRTGRWFRQDLEQAYARLAPHIPERHKVETQALATGLDLDPQLVAAINVFPELFHCSGFAVFGKATRDGKLYHGRVLDYMTTIGLQDASTTFLVAVEGQIPFANVGYAGFIGSVSGMNAQRISLGEMGGRGEGQWDGVPMATLMRRALEECSTLDEVTELWRKSPRTCEYFYVFADGKTRRAVGVAARPESIEFVQPGQAHELLGPGIEDAVVLSAGARLETLRGRVQERYGTIDTEVGQWLMSRPVAMQSNLHNVLFVPEDGVFYVAHASHRRPAAEEPYVRLDLDELLRSIR